MSRPAYADRGDLRGTLIEGIIEESEDETLMERYLGGEDVETSVLIDDLEKAIAKASFFPVLPVCSSTGVGTRELLDVIANGFPSPPDHPMPEVFTPSGASRRSPACDPAGPLVAEVVKTTSDPYVGRVSLVRVFSGTVRPDMTVHVSGHFSSFFGFGHVGSGSTPLGSRRGRTDRRAVVPARQAAARGAVGGGWRHLRDRQAQPRRDRRYVVGQGRTGRAQAVDHAGTVAAHRREPHAKTDEDKLAVGLQRLAAEDPTLRIDQNPETHQIVLWCMGEAHAGVVLDALAKRYGVSVDTVDVRIPLRETFGGKAKGHGRHVKQSGGHGQYAVCDIEVEPLPQGSGFEFVDKVVGGAVPRQFIPSVEKGVRAQMEKGVGAGYPMVDIRVTLFDGKSHSVDSSDFAFQMAGALALREAAAATTVNLLEPVDLVAVVIPDHLVGAVMSDLAGRRGRVLGTSPGDDERTVVNAEIPQVELTRYAIDLRALSHGAGNFTRSFARYEPMPESAAAKLKVGA